MSSPTPTPISVSTPPTSSNEAKPTTPPDPEAISSEDATQLRNKPYTLSSTLYDVALFLASKGQILILLWIDMRLRFYINPRSQFLLYIGALLCFSYPLYASSEWATKRRVKRRNEMRARLSSLEKARWGGVLVVLGMVYVCCGSAVFWWVDRVLGLKM